PLLGVPPIPVICSMILTLDFPLLEAEVALIPGKFYETTMDAKILSSKLVSKGVSGIKYMTWGQIFFSGSRAGLTNWSGNNIPYIVILYNLDMCNLIRSRSTYLYPN
ncbi:hypothetical protein L208DRAFT_1322451, partial [Tricholoma matsutake]